MEDTFPSLSLFPQSQTHCVAIHETAIENMVFNSDLAVDYDEAINVIADLSKRVISYLH